MEDIISPSLIKIGYRLKLTNNRKKNNSTIIFTVIDIENDIFVLKTDAAIVAGIHRIRFDGNKIITIK